MQSTFQRARRPEQKEERRQTILAAARLRADRDGVRNVSLGDIAAEVGIHKSALLRYFETREEIFLELMAAAWGSGERALAAELAGVPVDDVTAAACVLARSFAERPLFCDLLVHTPLNLERHVSVEAVRRYKLVSLGTVRAGAELLAARLSRFSVAECREVVATVAALTGQLWQIANPPADLAALYRSSPELEVACIELAPTLARTAALLLAGMSAEHSP